LRIWFLWKSLVKLLWLIRFVVVATAALLAQYYGCN